MRMVYGKCHWAKLKAKGFEFLESCNAGIYNALPSKALISAFRQDLQSNPVISSIFSSCHRNHLRNLFIGMTNQNCLKEADRTASTGCLRPLPLYVKWPKGSMVVLVSFFALTSMFGF